MSAEQLEKKLLESLEHIILVTDKKANALLNLKQGYLGSLFIQKTQADIDYILTSVLDYDVDQLVDFHKKVLKKLGVTFPEEAEKYEKV